MFAPMVTHFPPIGPDPGGFSFDPDKQKDIDARRRIAKERADWSRRLWVRRASYVGVALGVGVLFLGFLYAAVKVVRAAWGG